MKEIEILIESENGHDTKLIPEDSVPTEVSEQLKEDKWATVKKTDGSTEVLTKSDAPSDDDWKKSFTKPASKEVDAPTGNSSIPKNVVDTFKNKFENVESVMVTNKAKGG